ncbi:type II toxin-antitoxin system mRNA interferase toxin, RelE/StbE family [Faecalibaculum rodentium]
MSGTLPAEKHRDHSLSGNWAGFRECHLVPEWLQTPFMPCCHI